MDFELSQALLDALEEAIENNDSPFIIQTLEDLYAADISLILYEMNTQQSKYVIQLLDKQIATEIISNLDINTCTEFLKNFSSKEISQWIALMDSDDAADILQELSLKIREETLGFIDDKEQENNIRDLLHYEDDCAGGLMAKELIRVNLNWTIKQCIEEIRRQAEEVEKIYSVYVVDNDNRFLGRVGLKKMILAKDEALIADIFDDSTVAVETYLDQDEVADIMQKYDLEAVPVVNARGELVGRITIDDIVDVITEQADLDRQLMSGISEDIEESDSILMLSRARLPWLIIGIFGGLLGAKFIGFFEQDLIMLPAMAFFIPLITATGGNVGIQSSSIILQSLANKSLQDNDYFGRLLKVLLVAILNGLVIALLVFIFTVIFDKNIQLAFVVSTSLFFVVLLASVMGTITPLVLDRLNINPALASGPFITTANDLLGLFVYFTTASLLYH